MAPLGASTVVPVVRDYSESRLFQWYMYVVTLGAGCSGGAPLATPISLPGSTSATEYSTYKHELWIRYV